MIQNYWKRFIEETGRKDAVMKGSICPADDLGAAERACADIAGGTRCAMLYPESGYRTAMKGAAQTGDLNVIVDWNGKPVCTTETVGIEKKRFAELDESDFACEMSDREAKEAEFKRELDELGTELGDDTIIVIEKFCVIF